ncbi:MAG: VOC family protein [Bacilli bacterium]|nr:VOC family protein [Bacilli bacterium]
MKETKMPRFIGVSHVCIFVDDVEKAMDYYHRLLGAEAVQYVPHWKNEGFFKAGGFIKEAPKGDVSIGFMNVPGTTLTLEIMCYHYPKGRRKPKIFKANDVSGARHVALKITNIEEGFEHVKNFGEGTKLINTSGNYQVFQISKTTKDNIVLYGKDKDNEELKEKTAAILSKTKYFYFIDKYGLQWEFEQGHSDIGN